MLGVFGLGASISKRKWLAFYPAGWAIIAYLSLLNHNPVWWRHQMLVMVPTALMAAYGIFRIGKGFWGLNKTPGWWQKTLIF